MARGKQFPCGHRGKGNFCSSCAAPVGKTVEATAATASPQPDVDPKADKAVWEATFEDDPIELHHLPTPKLVLRAREILEAIGQGAPWHQFNGKRLNHDRTVISVPLGRRYRILFRTSEGSPQPVEVLSHESYNGTKPGKR